jgi:fucose 4-O-acetylase-like acetyltransferase
MLLGIVLHATSAYRGVKAPVTDVFSSPDLIFDEVFHAIHGFRMQLFFLISGFFTMLLQQRLGWGGMLRQRAVRIALPLAVGTVTIVRLTRWTKVELASQAWLDRRS